MSTNAYPATVKEAICRGVKVVERPSKIMLVAGLVLCILLMILDFSWWYLLLLPSGLVASFLYTMYATPKWRIWAYEHVADIHQFQRTAELAGLLARKSYDLNIGFMNDRQKEVLTSLQARFSETPIFVDDSSIPAETVVRRKLFVGTSRYPLMILNATGIQVPPDGFFEWDKIENERIARITFSRTMANTGTGAGGSKDLFRFEYSGERFELPFTLLAISAWELDLLAYVYRGRSELKGKSEQGLVEYVFLSP